MTMKIHDILKENLNERTKVLKTVANKFRQRLEDDWDCCIAITGAEGVGKSTLTVWLAALTDKNFSFDKNCVFIPDEQELEREYKSLPKYSSYLVDEAIRALYKLRWQDRMQQKLNELFTTERWRNIATFLVIPRFTDLNEYFRNHRVHFWAWVLERKRAILYINTMKDQFNRDPWFIDYMFKMKLKKKFFSSQATPDEIIEFEMRYNPLPKIIIEFDDLPEPVRSEYLKFKEASRKQIIAKEKEEEETKLHPQRIRSLVRREEYFRATIEAMRELKLPVSEVIKYISNKFNLTIQNVEYIFRTVLNEAENSTTDFKDIVKNKKENFTYTVNNNTNNKPQNSFEIS